MTPQPRDWLCGAGCGLAIGLSLCRCTPAQDATVVRDTHAAIDLTNAVCHELEGSGIGAPYTAIGCALAASGEQITLVLATEQARALCAPKASDAGAQ